MLAYYASRISENKRMTPEGYLICHNVPIARTGSQVYLGEELGIPERAGEPITIHRTPEEVFSPATIASFEGKPITDDHPGEMLDASNVGAFLKGVVKEVRRGEGEDSDKLLADLFIYDKLLVAKVEDGKREVSCGYDCLCSEGPDGEYYQHQIRGNHVAVVYAGRAGSQVAIRDAAPPKVERRKTPVKKNEDMTPFARIRRSFFSVAAKDADPEALADALDEIEEVVAGDDGEETAPAAPPEKEETAPTTDEEPPAWAAALMGQIEALNTRMDAMSAPKDSPESQLDELEEELAGGEAAVAEPAEEMDEDPDGEKTPATDEDEPVQDIDPATDGECEAAKDSALKLVRTMKPVIASMKDAKAKRRAVDALSRVARSMGRVPAVKGTDGYALALAAKTKRPRPTTDKAVGFDPAEQQKIYDSFNPHSKERR